MSQRELLNGQNSAEETQNKENSSNELIERIKIEGTPFWIIGQREKGYFAVMGENKITDTRTTAKEVQEDLVKEQYNITFRMIGIITEKMIEEILTSEKITIEEENNNNNNQKTETK